MLDFVNKDYLGFLSLDVDLMLDLVLHLRRFGEVAIDLAIHRERPASRGALAPALFKLLLFAERAFEIFASSSCIPLWCGCVAVAGLFVLLRI